MLSPQLSGDHRHALETRREWKLTHDAQVLTLQLLCSRDRSKFISVKILIVLLYYTAQRTASLFSDNNYLFVNNSYYAAL